jgi:hypothetical protein
VRFVGEERCEFQYQLKLLQKPLSHAFTRALYSYVVAIPRRQFPIVNGFTRTQEDCNVGCGTHRIFETLWRVAESHDKLSEWCRDTLLRATEPPAPRPSELAVIAEITATQAVLIDMLCILGRDKMSMQKAQEIVDGAHNGKYKEAPQLLCFAYSKAERPRFEGSASGDRPEERNEGVG